MSRELRFLELQERICSVPPKLSIKPDEFYWEVRDLLSSACEDGWLRTFNGTSRGGSKDVWQMVKYHPHKCNGGVEFVINLGREDMPRNQKRSKEFPHFERFDGAWFDFALTGFADSTTAIKLMGYTFEIRLPDWPDRSQDERHPNFVRFDLNPPEHPNAKKGERSHVHVGSEKFSIPSSLMSPLEILELFVHGLRPRDLPGPE